jgi:8-hydroxy-5-deazaflavin:NADPH oxidoreductase
LTENEEANAVVETVGVIGAGPIGRAVAAHAAAAGQHVLISNSRGSESLSGLVAELGDSVFAASVEDAANADLVVLAVPFVRAHEVGKLIGDWTGRIVVDATNEFAEYAPYSGRVDLGHETVSEFVARQLPGATIVKAFNAMYADYVAPSPRHEAGRQVVFYAGDDDSANKVFSELIEGWGFAPVFVGGLRAGGQLLQLDGHLSLLHVLKQD